MFCSEWAAVLGCGCSWLQAWLFGLTMALTVPRGQRASLSCRRVTLCRTAVNFCGSRKKECEPVCSS